MIVWWKYVYINFSNKKKRACGREVAVYMCYNTIGYDLAFQQKNFTAFFDNGLNLKEWFWALKNDLIKKVKP